MFGGSPFATAPFASIGANTFNVSIAENASLSDTFVATPIFRSNIAETVTGADSVSVIASIFNALAAELATGTDSATVVASTFRANIEETAIGTDAPFVAPSTFNAQIAETIAALDQVYAYAVFAAVISESSTIIDVATARLLWELINDSQNAGWQTINTAQSTTWTTINDSVPTTWSDIPTLD
jgi:hypothetical protein